MKGQLLSQPFMYIFYIVVAALILFFGVKMIINLTNFSGEADVVNFVNDIQKDVNRVYSDNFGSLISLSELNVPSSIKEICVINNGLNPDYNLITNEEFKEKLELGIGADSDNLYLFGEFKDESIKSYKVDNLDVYINNPVCDLNQNNKISIVLENKGNKIVAKK